MRVSLFVSLVVFHEMARTKQTQRGGTEKRPRRVFVHPFQKKKDVGTRTIKGFKVMKKIATGAFGKVYKGKRIEDDQACALKFVDLRDEETNEGALLEFELANLFGHAGIGPKVFGYWRIPSLDLALMVTELWSITLEDFLQDRKIKKPSATIMKILTKRVQEMHETGHVHLDIHAGNVFLRLNQTGDVEDVCLADFGKATHHKGIAQWQLDDASSFYKLKKSSDPKNLDWQMVEQIKKGKI